MRIFCFSIVSTLLLIYTCCAFEVNDKIAEQTISELGIVDTAIFEEEHTITRNDSISLIMRAIGVPDNVFEESYGAPDIQMAPFDDADNYFSICKFTTGTNYVGLSMQHTDVILGEAQWEDERGIKYIQINPTRPVTTKEAVAFMVRCLKNPPMDEKDLEQTFARGLEVGLIKTTDSFYLEPDKPISCNDFFVMLQRFLYQPMYLYFDNVSEFIRDFCYAEAGNEDYITFLKQRALQE